MCLVLAIFPTGTAPDSQGAFFGAIGLGRAAQAKGDFRRYRNALFERFAIRRSCPCRALWTIAHLAGAASTLGAGRRVDDSQDNVFQSGGAVWGLRYLAESKLPVAQACLGPYFTVEGASDRGPGCANGMGLV